MIESDQAWAFKNFWAQSRRGGVTSHYLGAFSYTEIPVQGGFTLYVVVAGEEHFSCLQDPDMAADWLRRRL